MALGAAYEEEAVTALVNSAVTPRAQPDRKFSAWRMATAVPRAAAEAGARVMGAAAEVVGGFGQVAGAYPELLGPSVPLSGEQRRQADTQRQRLLTEGVEMSSEAGDLLRQAGRGYRPDPVTAHAAEQVVYGFTRGATMIVGGAMAMGPAGVLAAGGAEGMGAADDLLRDGVTDVAARTKAGAVQGAGLALAALPLIGQTKLATAGLYAVGGPGGFVAQQAATREILQNAGYDKIGAQYDPFDPVGLAVATLLPAGFAAYGLRQQRLQRAADSLPDLPPRADAPADAPPAAAPFPSTPSAVTRAVRAYPTEVVDAARVSLLAQARAGANPGAVNNLRAMDQHEAALTRAEDQIAAGEPVQVADVAPAQITPEQRAANLAAWFEGSRATDRAGAPLVLYRGRVGAPEDSIRADVVYFTPDKQAASEYAQTRIDEGVEGEPSVLSAYVRLLNPADEIDIRRVAMQNGIDLPHMDYPAAYLDTAPELVEALKREGFDGAVGTDGVPTDGREIKSYAVFSRGAIKATSNSGRFDPNSASLTDGDYTAWADQITAAIREMQAQARPTDAPAAATQLTAAADARPTVTNKAGEAYIDTRGAGVRLHGTGKPIAALSDEYALSGDSRNIYGQGFYTTDAADIAAGYMKKGGRNAALYEVRVSEGARLYDMEQPMSPEVAQIARDNMGDDFPTENGETGAPLTTLREVYDEYRAESRNNGLSRDDVQEVFDGIRYRLEAQGYAGFQHIGGAATGNRAHTVQILWMPERDVTITPISLDQFKPNAPTTPQAANPEAAAPARGAGDAPAVPGAADAGRPAAGVEAAGLTARDTTEPVPADNNAPGQSGGAQGADSGSIVTEQQEAASPPADGFVRLYHSGSDPTAGGYFAAVPSGGVFDGFFALRDGWGSYGTGAKYFADVPETAVLKQHDLDYELDYDVVRSSLQKAMPWLDEEDFDSAWTAVIEDRAGKIGSDDLQRIMREDSDGAASWEAQRIRGKVAKDLGYQAVEMDDENGTSWLIVSGTPLKRVIPNDQPAPISGGATDAAGLTGPAGTSTEAITERGLTVPLRYRLTEAGDLTTSHTNDLTPNPAFPAELQPRDRARAASAEQISRIENAIRPELLGESVKASDGAPIVGPDAVVESGNARMIALRRAYESGRADAYRAWLADNAERFGLTRQQVESMRQPVLVRERLGDVDRAEFARQANESAVAAMSPTEQAMSDARRINDLTGLVANEDGTINMAQSGDFVRLFVQQAVAPTERGMMLQADGRLSQAGMNRLRNAVFAKAYGDADILAMLTESTDANVRNILAGMLRAAPDVARLADLAQAGARQDADIAGPLVEAVRLFSQLRSEGRTVQQFLAQGSMFGDGLAPEIQAMLEAVSLNARAPKRIAEMITGMVQRVDALGDARQGSMFDDAPTGSDAVAGAAQLAVMDSRIAAAQEQFPALAVMVDGMEAPMPAADFLAAAKAEADELAADAPLMRVAAECALLNGPG